MTTCPLDRRRSRILASLSALGLRAWGDLVEMRCGRLPTVGTRLFGRLALVRRVGDFARAALYPSAVLIAAVPFAVGSRQAAAVLPPPLVVQAPAAVTQATATLRGWIEPYKYTLSTCVFEYGASIGLGVSVPCSSGSLPGEVLASLGGLRPATTYYVRLSASGSQGPGQSKVESFMTSSGALSSAPGAAQSLPYLQLAEQGATRAQHAWRDAHGNWYDEVLHGGGRFPLATIWGVVPLFETLNALAIARPTPAHRKAVAAFARVAESYFNRSLRPTAGYAPYPNDRGQVRTWFDDNGWWGIAFMDAYRATGSRRYLADAARAFAFIAAQGWDRAGGGIWWNTSHPYKSGPALASDTLLGAMLYQQTRRGFYLTQVEKFLGWADAHFLTDYRLYAQTNTDPTPTPYVEGPMVEAHEILCKSGRHAACARAKELASGAWQRFQDRLTMGPQFDTIYLHWMLVYAAQTGDARWPNLAKAMALEAQSNALDSQGLYLGAWDGTPITEHEAQPGMLQTHAATLELFAWLAAAH